MNIEDALRNYIQLNQYSSKEVHDALKKMLERCIQLYGKEKKKMDEKEILKDRAEKDELLETVGALNSILPQYMDEIDDYKEKPSIKTDWLNKKMR